MPPAIEVPPGGFGAAAGRAGITGALGGFGAAAAGLAAAGGVAGLGAPTPAGAAGAAAGFVVGFVVDGRTAAGFAGRDRFTARAPARPRAAAFFRAFGLRAAPPRRARPDAGAFFREAFFARRFAPVFLRPLFFDRAAFLRFGFLRAAIDPPPSGPDSRGARKRRSTRAR
jgi:hypothetical protein